MIEATDLRSDPFFCPFIAPSGESWAKAKNWGKKRLYLY
jgi:hypothetical protein